MRTIFSLEPAQQNEFRRLYAQLLPEEKRFLDLFMKRRAGRIGEMELQLAQWLIRERINQGHLALRKVLIGEGYEKVFEKNFRFLTLRTILGNLLKASHQKQSKGLKHKTYKAQDPITWDKTYYKTY